MKTLKIWLAALLCMLCLVACSPLLGSSVTTADSDNLDNYKYIYLPPVGEQAVSQGESLGKSLVPADLVGGILVKRGFIRVPKVDPARAGQTLIVNYAESGRRKRKMGHAIEVTVQMVSAKTQQVVCSCTGEGQGKSDTDGIRMAIDRALTPLFLP